jgi:hypothetical protein
VERSEQLEGNQHEQGIEHRIYRHQYGLRRSDGALVHQVAQHLVDAAAWSIQLVLRNLLRDQVLTLHTSEAPRTTSHSLM